MVRYWTCRKCGQRHPRTRQLCPCGRRRPKASRPAHVAALEQPYEWWVGRFGERCGICGAEPKPGRRLDRDHDHKTGAARGLLCHWCNRRLGQRTDVAWLRAALAYLAASE